MNLNSLRLLAASALVTALFALLPGTPALAADAPKLLGKFDDWAAYTYGSGTDRICYVLSEPSTMLPKGASRGDVYFMVTHRPGRGIKNEVSMRVGYVFGATSKPFAMIDKDRYQMFSGVPQGGEHQYWAWLENTKEEAKMVKSLRAGSSMVIKGTSARKTLTTDTYSLKGSSAALERIDTACR